MNTVRPVDPTAICHSCGSGDLLTAPAYAGLHRVTSDCKPWPPGGGLARCLNCGLVQALISPVWEADAEAIYRNYTIYHQSGGAEQNVFDAQTGVGAPRSERIIQRLKEAVPLPSCGRVLDIGCGNGAFLNAWSRLIPGWRLCGSEVSDKYRDQVERIPGFEQLYTGPFDEIPGEFDLISMIHVLEHIPSPVRYLERLRERLCPGGLLLVEVPDCEQNVFMLLVADHCTHFSPPLLAGVAEAAGFEVLERGAGWVAKEVSLVARRPATRVSPVKGDGSRDASERVFSGWRQLQAILTKVEPLARRSDFGLFGTAIAATWLDGQTQQAARFFVDEDVNRVGRTHLGRPILAPSALPRQATVFVALPQPLADAVAGRLRDSNATIDIVLP